MKKELTLLALASLLLAACGGKEDPIVVPDTPKAPSAPANLKLHKATETSLQFQWDAVEGAASYAWELQKDGAKVDEGSVGTRNATISGLNVAFGAIIEALRKQYKAKQKAEYQDDSEYTD